MEFIHGDFQTFLETNQNQFDFIVNHGTFTWVSAQEQDYILQIVAKFLKNLGDLFAYMCYPGSSALQPIQKLLHLVDQQNNESS
nr:class I SAM-dependent methyltransferase [Acinetobacter equi]